VVACALLPAALDARAPGAPADSLVPTAIEEALMEHACGALRPAGTLENDIYLACRNRQLASLRADFGRDLKRLSPAQRRTIDSACSGLRESQGQDVYVECLTARLTSLRGRSNPAPTEAVAGSAASEEPAPAVPSPRSTPPSSSRAVVWIGTGLVAVMVVAAGSAFAVRNPKRRYGACRTCGVKLLEHGDLCQPCRREAADALRRATAERADQARVQEDEQRRQAARELEQQQFAAEEETRRQLREEAQREHARQEEARIQRQKDDEARQQRQIDVSASEDEFDPYAVLGLPQGASSVDVDEAYKTVRSKFDLDLVADMGTELQEHMKRKAEAVERAYETLSTAKSRT
jgi:hypothetical protein